MDLKSRASLARMDLSLLVNESGISIEDIAAWSGLSPSTVSSFLDGNGTSRPTTIEKIEKYIKGKKRTIEMITTAKEFDRD